MKLRNKPTIGANRIKTDKAYGSPDMSKSKKEAVILARQNKELVLKLKETSKLASTLEQNLARKEMEFQKSLSEAKKALEQLQSVYEARICELTESESKRSNPSDQIKKEEDQNNNNNKLTRIFQSSNQKGKFNAPAIPSSTSPTASAGNNELSSQMNHDKDGSDSSFGVIIDGKITVDFNRDKIRYHEIIGKGGSGVIYRCTIHALSFVSKVISTEFLGDAEISQIKREIAIMQSLSHPNIVRYLGSSISPMEICIYMELYKETLHGIISRRREKNQFFTVQEVAWYGWQISEGLKYLHNLYPFPIVHRDLKSENIFCVQSKNGLPHIKIGDFGEAKYLSTRLTHTINLGTDEFRAPEVYGLMSDINKNDGGKLSGGHNEKADIWSLGMLLFELITLDIPYRSNNIDRFVIPEMVEKGIRPTFPHHVPISESWEDMIQIFQKCTEKEPSRRPTSKKLSNRFRKIYQSF